MPSQNSSQSSSRPRGAFRASKRRQVSLICGSLLLDLACGDSGYTPPPGNPPADVPGYYVDCDPTSPDEPLICMRQQDWLCPIRDNYIPEALCAYVHGGTPSQYDMKPELVEFNGDMSLDCADLPDGVLESFWTPTECTDCYACGVQSAGKQKWPMVDGWNELPWCTMAVGCPMPDDGIPTTGETPTSGGDETSGDATSGDETGVGEGSGIWICNGSPMIWGTMQDSIPPSWQKDISMAGGLVPDCVYATEMYADENCLKLCETKDALYEMEATDNSYLWFNFPCDDLSNYIPVEATDPYSQCSGHGPMPVLDPIPFVGDAELTTAFGGKAQTVQLSGLMNLDLRSCSAAGVCEVVITELRSGPRTIHGTYSIGSSDLEFTITELEVSLLQPAEGLLDRASGEIWFPGKRLFASVSTGDVLLGRKPISFGVQNAAFVLDAVAGRMDGKQITLDLGWETPGGELQLALNLTAG